MFTKRQSDECRFICHVNVEDKLSATRIVEVYKVIGPLNSESRGSKRRFVDRKKLYGFEIDFMLINSKDFESDKFEQIIHIDICSNDFRSIFEVSCDSSHFRNFLITPSYKFLVNCKKDNSTIEF